MLFNRFPREVGPPRKTVYNLKEYLNYINVHNGKKKAIYSSIYWFKKIKENFKPDYDSAVIDKIYFDFDDKSCDAHFNMIKLHRFCEEKNLKHSVVMSGRGYHLYVHCKQARLKYKRHAIKQAQKYFIDKLKLIVDPQVIGNTAQLARIPNTYHPIAGRFCIPLNQDQLERGNHYIRRLANRQNFVKNIFIGKELFNISQFDSKPRLDFKFCVDLEVNKNMIEERVIENCPDCVRRIINTPDAGWKERYLLILYLRERGFLIEEAADTLKRCLSDRKFYHCIKEEKQLQYIYDRHDIVFPKCEKIIQDGLCVGKCQFYGKDIYK